MTVFFCTICAYEWCTIILNDCVSLFLYNLKIKWPLFSISYKTTLTYSKCEFYMLLWTLFVFTDRDPWWLFEGCGHSFIEGEKMQWSSPSSEQKLESDSATYEVDLIGM